ncbi:MAG: DNA repair protein RadA [Actinomycetales bacterium]
MAKTAPSYRCRDCGAEALRWVGRCPRCGEFGTVEEAPTLVALPGVRAKAAPTAPPRGARRVSDIGPDQVRRDPTGLGEFDHVLGGGLVPGQVVLLAGEPGVGKSTLLLMVAERLASRGQTVLYVSGEESVEQLAVRGRRVGAGSDSLLLADETDLGVLLGHIEAHQPSLVVVDSVQTVASADVDGRAGGVAQVVEVTQVLTRIGKTRKIPLLLIGQSTKDNSVAGPRALEHLVDTVLTFEGDRHTSLRLLRATKNRYGPADEVVCFEQADDGLREVGDPSLLFREHRQQPVPGTCVTVGIDGRRALLTEVQSLVVPAADGHPRRGVTGLDSSRVAMLAAVTARWSGLPLAQRDLFVATVGGAKISDPACDLGVCLAIASAGWDAPMPEDVLAIGEVALSGDIRPVRLLEARISEAVRCGYRRILVPPGSSGRLGRASGDVACIELRHLQEGLMALRRIAGLDQS